MDNPPKRYRVIDAIRVLGICRKTLVAWEERGYIKGYRTPSNQRYYDPEEIDTLFAKGRAPKETKEENEHT